MSLYLDYNATAPLTDAAKKAMIDTMSLIGNPSSVHQFGRQMRYHIEQARQTIASYFPTKPSDIIFTSGATEANHLALCGFEGTVIISAVEHDSVDQARPDRLVCPVDAQGKIKLDVLESLLKNTPKPTLLSVMAVNNETGVCQPLEAVVELAKRYGAFVHCDAVQAIGRLDSLGQAPFWNDIDLISLSAHKLGGPQGVGALVIRTDIPLKAQVRGGGQERSIRSGTENSLGIIGFGAAMETIKSQDWKSVQTVRDTLEDQLQAHGALVLIPDSQRLPNTSIIVMPEVKSATQVMSFDLKGIAVSAGSACSSGKVKPSRVLAAMGVPTSLADCSIRISLGPICPPDLIDRFINTWIEIYRTTTK